MILYAVEQMTLSFINIRGLSVPVMPAVGVRNPVSPLLEEKSDSPPYALVTNLASPLRGHSPAAIPSGMRFTTTNKPVEVPLHILRQNDLTQCGFVAAKADDRRNFPDDRPPFVETRLVGSCKADPDIWKG